MDPTSSAEAPRQSPIYLNDVNRHLARLRVALEDPAPERVKEALLEIHEAIASLRDMVAELPGRPEIAPRPQPLPTSSTPAS